MFPSSVIEISRKAYRANLRFLGGVLGPNVTMSSVVKGNAYGHGIELFVGFAEELGVRHFSVFGAAEAHRALGVVQNPETRLCIMSDVEGPGLEWAVEHGVEFWVFDRGRLEAAAKIASRLGKPAKLHIEIETGLHRTGIDSAELDKVAELILQAGKSIEVIGLCTHFAGAESVGNYVRIQQQREMFGESCR